MIELVELQGFKGLTTKYKLKGPTLLLGPNGAGKTACQEALTFALTRRVPAGKTLDAVAQWFDPRGGWVRVWDSDSRWIQRGISRDHRKGSISETLATSDDVEGQPPDLGAWIVADCTLDVREFLALSPDKRREYVLRMVGGGTWDAETMDQLEAEFAVQVGGPGTLPGVLGSPHDLPEDLQCFAEAWTEPRGVREWIMLCLQRAKGTLSETIADLEALAKDEISSHRRAAAEGRAAAKELEAAAQGARVAAGDVAGRQDEVEKARIYLTNRQHYQDCRDQAAKKVAETTAELTKATGRLQELGIATEGASKAWVAAVEPKTPGEGGNPWAEKRESARQALVKGRDGYQAAVQRQERWQEKADRLEQLDLQLGEHNRMSIARILAIVNLLPTDLHPDVKELQQLVSVLAADWSAVRSRLEREMLDAEEAVTALRPQLSGPGSLQALQKTVEEAAKALRAIEADFAKSQGDLIQGQHGYREARHAYEQLLADFTRAQAAEQEFAQTAENLGIRFAKEKKALVAAEKELDGYPAAEALAATLREAEAAANTAVAAYGKVTAYDDAIRRAESAEVMERAWKLTAAALKVIRDELVGGSMADLLGDIDRVLVAAGRKERCYLELENERGRPIFDLGWQVGEKRVSVAALSAGESVLFLAALCFAILMRTEGLKILLVEGDPLDTTNLPAFLKGLLGVAKDMDCTIVSTAQHVPAPARWGWEVREL